MPARSIRNFARSASAVVLLALAVRADDPPAIACGFSGDTVEESTTFDPNILGDDTWEGLLFQPFVHGFGGACDDCATKAIADDWRSFLGEVPDWDRVLRKASASDLAVLHAFALGKAKAPPRGYEKMPAGPRIAAALGYVRILRDAEPYATLGGDKPTPTPPADLLGRIKTGMKETKDPFLVQRYAFLAIRELFYARAFRDAIAFHDANTAALAGPSVDLRWRARYYIAGALAKDGQRGRANLELARITSNYQPLAGAAAGDFQPIEEADWQATLGLAKSVREKTELWRLVGIKADGVVAMEKILELDPKSNLLALLLVRELTRAESNLDETGDASVLAAQKKALERIERIAARIAAAPGADRPWLAELVVGHVAAKRGELVAARVHLQKAVALAPTKAAVATQAKASLALALVLDWKIDTAHEEELANLMLALDPKFSRLGPVQAKVRGTLAKAYAVAGKLVDAEFLSAGSGTWNDLDFVKKMIARSAVTSTAFDRFVIGGLTKEQLGTELYGRYLLMGDFIDAQKALARKPVAFGVDPFLIHIQDCHDCDREAYKGDAWNDATFVARLIELQKAAAGKSEAAAQAALQIGNALYNLTWSGNARVVLESTRQATRDTRPAEKLYKRAYDLTKNRELKAKAAFLAAKAELARIFEQESTSDNFPIPTTWFPILRGMADTKYYKEVLSECGNFRRWVAKKP